MFPINVKASEQVAVLDVINPTSQGVSNATTAWILAANFQKFLALIQVGAFGASATLDANIKQATDSSGTGAKNIGSGRAIVQALAAGGNNKVFTIDLDAQELDVANSFNYIQLTVTVGTAATLTSAQLLGFIARNYPASAYNAAAVLQQVG
jgi:hypothetical protein